MLPAFTFDNSVASPLLKPAPAAASSAAPMLTTAVAVPPGGAAPLSGRLPGLVGVGLGVGLGVGVNPPPATPTTLIVPGVLPQPTPTLNTGLDPALKHALHAMLKANSSNGGENVQDLMKYVSQQLQSQPDTSTHGATCICAICAPANNSCAPGPGPGGIVSGPSPASLSASREEEFMIKYGSLANFAAAPPTSPAAVKENTYPLRVWIEEHRANPYPTKSEKLMLSIITKMTLTQVSTWFANARRRLKKERRGSPTSDLDLSDIVVPFPSFPTHPPILAALQPPVAHGFTGLGITHQYLPGSLPVSRPQLSALPILTPSSISTKFEDKLSPESKRVVAMDNLSPQKQQSPEKMYLDKSENLTKKELSDDYKKDIPASKSGIWSIADVAMTKQKQS